jgi:hypothetical protein
MPDFTMLPAGIRPAGAEPDGRSPAGVSSRERANQSNFVLHYSSVVVIKK